MKLRFLPFLGAVLLLVLSACHNSGGVIATGLHIEVTKVTRSSDGSIQVTWRLRNPNVVAYLLDHATHKISLNGAVIGTVTSQERLGIPREGEVEQTFPLTPANGGVGAQLAQLVGRDPVPYQIESNVWFLIMDDDRERATLTGSGTVAVTAQ